VNKITKLINTQDKIDPVSLKTETTPGKNKINSISKRTNNKAKKKERSSNRHPTQ